eukprot:816233-Pyramimonas_sp.AAC.1
MFKRELTADLSDRRNTNLTSSASLAKSLDRQLHTRGLPKGLVTSFSLNLGVDFAPGQACSTNGALRKRRPCVQLFKLRPSSRYAFYSKMVVSREACDGDHAFCEPEVLSVLR